MKRFVAIGFVWAGCALAWMILGGTLAVRTDQSATSMEGGVHDLWGPPGVQFPPEASYMVTEVEREMTSTIGPDGLPIEQVREREISRSVPLRIESSDIDVALDLEHRKRGLMWFATYDVDFEGRYRFENVGDAARDVLVKFPLSSERVGYDDFVITRTDGTPVEFETSSSVAHFTAHVPAGEGIGFTVSYATRGTGNWRYDMQTDDTRIRDFRLSMRTNFDNVDFPLGSLSPTEHGATDGGWEGEWDFRSLISNAPIGVVLPEKLNPGPLAAEITFFAPVCLLFFFFVVALVATVREVPLHPMHYFFLGCAFFAFHLLFAYLVDHLPVGASFLLSALTSVFLVISYARLFTGMRFAVQVMGTAQMIYLVLFSYSFFLEGFTGLAVTVGAIVTLFVMMQLTGKMDWSRWGKKEDEEGGDSPGGPPPLFPSSRKATETDPAMAAAPQVF